MPGHTGCHAMTREATVYDGNPDGALLPETPVTTCCSTPRPLAPSARWMPACWSLFTREHHEWRWRRTSGSARVIGDNQPGDHHRIGELVESTAQESGLHVKRVALYAELFCQLLGHERGEVRTHQAPPLHDIGRGIPDAILHKPGKLTPREWEIMKTHTQLGRDMLSGSEIHAIPDRRHHRRQSSREVERHRLPPPDSRGCHPWRAHRRPGGRVRCPGLGHLLQTGLAPWNRCCR